jgi:hypothetical protein
MRQRLYQHVHYPLVLREFEELQGRAAQKGIGIRDELQCRLNDPGSAMFAPCALPEASPQDTPEARPSPILRRPSRPRYTALRLAAGHSGGCCGPLGARQSPRAQGGHWRRRTARAGQKRAFGFPICRTAPSGGYPPRGWPAHLWSCR